MEQYLIIVSRDRPELVETLASSYGQTGEAVIHLDRREPGQVYAWRGHGTDRRSTSVITDLQTQGFLVIPQHESRYKAA